MNSVNCLRKNNWPAGRIIKSVGKIYPVPEIGKEVYIVKRDKVRNRKRETWEGITLKRYESIILVRLHSGLHESFIISDFRHGLLSFQYVQETS